MPLDLLSSGLRHSETVIWPLDRCLLVKLGLHTSALPRISHPVASDKDLIRNKGVFPIHPSIPSTIAGGPGRAESASEAGSWVADFSWLRWKDSTSLHTRARPTPAINAVPT